jgi:hypothetical protein
MISGDEISQNLPAFILKSAPLSAAYYHHSADILLY